MEIVNKIKRQNFFLDNPSASDNVIPALGETGHIKNEERKRPGEKLNAQMLIKSERKIL